MGEYVEDSVLTLPAILDGVETIGDLWNCRNSTKIEHVNLFGGKENLKSEFVSQIPRQKLDYSFSHSNSTKDKTFGLKIGVDATLQILFIKLKLATGQFTNDITKHFYEELLDFKYDLETYTLKVKPCAENYIDEETKRKIVSGELNCTHFVSELSLGVEIYGEIVIRDEELKKLDELTGNVIGKMILFQVSLILKTGLNAVAQGKDEHVKNIRLTTNPINLNLSQPSSILEMLQIIGNISNVIKSHSSPAPGVSENLRGTPTNFRLVPITRIIDFKIARLFKCLENSLSENFIRVVSTLEDFFVVNHIKSVLCRKDRRLQFLLQNSNNPLTIAINERELGITAKARELLDTATQAMNSYKIGQVGVEEIFKIVEKFELEYPQDLQNEIDQYFEKAQYELDRIKYNKIIQFDQKICKIFSSSQDLVDWEEAGQTLTRMEINFRDFEFSQEFFHKLARICQFLGQNDVNFEIGCPLPNIMEIIDDKEEKFPIKLTILGQNYEYSMDLVDAYFAALYYYFGFDISCKKDYFYRILVNKTISFINEMSDIPSLISSLALPAKIQICESITELHSKICNDFDKMKIVTILGSNYEALNGFFHLSKSLNEAVVNSIEWIFVDFEMDDLPLNLVFQRGAITACAYDNYEILIMEQLINSSNEMSILGINRPRYLYPVKMKNLSRVCQFFGANLANFDDENLEICINTQVQGFLNLLQSCNQENIEFISQIGRICLEKFPDLSSIFASHCWNFRLEKFSSNTKLIENWDQMICNDLQHFQSQLTETHKKISIALLSIRHWQNLEIFEFSDEIFSEILNDSVIPEEIKLEIGEAIHISSQELKLEEFFRIFTKFYNQIDSNSDSFELKFLIECIESELKLDKFSYLEAFYEKNFQNFFESQSQYELLRAKISQRNIPQVIEILSKFRRNDPLFKICMLLNEVNSISLKNLFTLLDKIKLFDFEEEILQILWQDCGFLYLIDKYLHEEKLIVTIFENFSKDLTIPKYFPRHISEKMKPLILKKISQERKFQLWEVDNPSNNLEILKYISATGKIPQNFSNQVKEMQIKMPFWNEEFDSFETPMNIWALNEVIDSIEDRDYQIIIENFPTNIEIQNETIQVHELWQEKFGPNLQKIGKSEFETIYDISVEARDSDWNSKIPWYIQCLKIGDFTFCENSENINEIYTAIFNCVSLDDGKDLLHKIIQNVRKPFPIFVPNLAEENAIISLVENVQNAEITRDFKISLAHVNLFGIINLGEGACEKSVDIFQKLLPNSASFSTQSLMGYLECSLVQLLENFEGNIEGNFVIITNFPEDFQLLETITPAFNSFIVLCYPQEYLESNWDNLTNVLNRANICKIFIDPPEDMEIPEENKIISQTCGQDDLRKLFPSNDVKKVKKLESFGFSRFNFEEQKFINICQPNSELYEEIKDKKFKIITKFTTMKLSHPEGIKMRYQNISQDLKNRAGIDGIIWIDCHVPFANDTKIASIFSKNLDIIVFDKSTTQVFQIAVLSWNFYKIGVKFPSILYFDDDQEILNETIEEICQVFEKFQFKMPNFTIQLKENLQICSNELEFHSKLVEFILKKDSLNEGHFDSWLKDVKLDFQHICQFSNYDFLLKNRSFSQMKLHLNSLRNPDFEEFKPEVWLALKYHGNELEKFASKNKNLQIEQLILKFSSTLQLLPNKCPESCLLCDKVWEKFEFDQNNYFELAKNALFAELEQKYRAIEFEKCVQSENGLIEIRKEFGNEMETFWPKFCQKISKTIQLTSCKYRMIEEIQFEYFEIFQIIISKFDQEEPEDIDYGLKDKISDVIRQIYAEENLKIYRFGLLNKLKKKITVICQENLEDNDANQVLSYVFGVWKFLEMSKVLEMNWIEKYNQLEIAKKNKSIICLK